MEESNGKGKELAVVEPCDYSLDNWDRSKFEEFSVFLGFSTIGLEKDIVKMF